MAGWKDQFNDSHTQKLLEKFNLDEEAVLKIYQDPISLYSLVSILSSWSFLPGLWDDRKEYSTSTGGILPIKIPKWNLFSFN
jgi:hypothetical protein